VVRLFHTLTSSSTPRGTAYLPEVTLEAAREIITERSLYEGEPDGVIVPLAIALDADR